MSGEEDLRTSARIQRAVRGENPEPRSAFIMWALSDMPLTWFMLHAGLGFEATVTLRWVKMVHGGRDDPHTAYKETMWEEV